MWEGQLTDALLRRTFPDKALLSSRGGLFFTSCFLREERTRELSSECKNCLLSFLELPHLRVRMVRGSLRPLALCPPPLLTRRDGQWSNPPRTNLAVYACIELNIHLHAQLPRSLDAPGARWDGALIQLSSSRTCTCGCLRWGDPFFLACVRGSGLGRGMGLQASVTFLSSALPRHGVGGRLVQTTPPEAYSALGNMYGARTRSAADHLASPPLA